MSRRSVEGVSLIELVVAIVLIGILGVAFMAMYATVTQQNSSGDDIAAMTWLGEGAMESVLAQRPCCTAVPSPVTAGPYTVTTTLTYPAPAGQPGYLVTVNVSCTNGSCSAITFTAHAYAIQ